MILEQIIEDFSILDDWEDRYRYLIELGRTLEPLEPEAHCDRNKVQGCVSQVWLVTEVERDPEGKAVLTFRGDSDAHIVRGLVALVLAIFSGHTPAEIVSEDPQPLFKELGLSAHLTPQRSNGVRSMVERIKNEARRTAETAIV